MATVRRMNVCKFHPFLVIPAKPDEGQVEGQRLSKCDKSKEEVWRVIHLIYVSRSLPGHRWPMCSTLVLFLSSAPGESDGYMERGVPTKWLTTLHQLSFNNSHWL